MTFTFDFVLVSPFLVFFSRFSFYYVPGYPPRSGDSLHSAAMAAAGAAVARLNAAIASDVDNSYFTMVDRRRVLEALAKLEPATLAQQAEAFVAAFMDAKFRDEAADLARRGLEDELDQLRQRAWSDLAYRLTAARGALAKFEDPFDAQAEAFLYEALQDMVGPEALAILSDVVVSMIEAPNEYTRMSAISVMQILKPVTFAQYAHAVLARLDDSSDCVRGQALETLRLQLKPSTLARHAAAIVARLDDESELVRMEALLTLEMLEPLALAQHADAVVARLSDVDAEVQTAALRTLMQLDPVCLANLADAVAACFDRFESGVRQVAVMTLAKLKPATLARYADAVVTLINDEEERVRGQALLTLRKLEPARLARYATAVFTRFEDDNGYVRCVAWSTLGALPRSVFDPFLFDPHDDDNCMRAEMMGRVGWYRLRLRLRLKCLLLYWYALPYRPSGAGHARDVDAWGRMVGSRQRRETAISRKRLTEERGAAPPRKRRETRHTRSA